MCHLTGLSAFFSPWTSLSFVEKLGIGRCKSRTVSPFCVGEKSRKHLESKMLFTTPHHAKWEMSNKTNFKFAKTMYNKCPILNLLNAFHEVRKNNK